jgi:hypothetical protein
MAKRNDFEHQEQVTLFKWLALQYPDQYDSTYAIPNAGRRTPRQGAYMKAEGLKAGVPDICMAYPSNGLHGLYIEYKTTKGNPTKSQREWIARLDKNGYKAEICYGIDHAIRTIKSYLEDK